MIRVWNNLRADATIDALLAKARRGARSNPNQAIHAGAAALSLTHSREDTYGPAARTMTDIYSKLKRPREALSCAWYSGDTSQQQELLAHCPPVDRARTYAHWAQLSSGNQRKASYSKAASELDKSEHSVRAAIYFERADMAEEARTLWSRLAQRIDGSGHDLYAAGLARFNLARQCLAMGDDGAGREATVAAVHRLEEAADRFESIGQRERAFDCYHVLIAIGGLTRTFEHVLEGSVNAIRILSEDNLRYHALRLYEHSLGLAEQAGEHAAGASLARDMTEYARHQGLIQVATRGILRQAALWQQAARAVEQRKGPLEIAENAYLASLLAFAEAGHYRQVGALYRTLSELDIEASRKKHYGRAAQRYAGTYDASNDGASDDRFGRHVQPPDVWFDDLIEWEEAGRASEACAGIVLDPQEQGESITRRNALVGRLVALAAEEAEGELEMPGQVTLARYLAPIELYSLLSPLEALYRNRHADVRLAATQAMSHYFYKRTFVTIETALSDTDARVQTEAVQALERLRFDHAFDPLARIFQTTSSSSARVAAVRTLARIDILESAELLLGVLDHGGTAERKAAIAALKSSRGLRFVEAAREALPHASDRQRKAIEDVLSSRGIAA